MTQEQPESSETPVKASPAPETAGNSKPVFGASGRKIIYDKDGKPCRSCNTLLDFQQLTFKRKSAPKAPVAKLPSALREEPPDVEQLGRSSWTLLHLIAATYPEQPTLKEQADMKQFVKLFGQFYPCWFCADDFRKYVAKHEPATETQDSLGQWLCGAHNEVNEKLGKPAFDCTLWKKRWKDGWE